MFAAIIDRLVALHESLLAKYSEQEGRIKRLERKQLPVWVRAILKVLELVVLVLVMAWVASHTTPAIDRVLGLLNEPVSSAKQPSAVRRDAGKAVRRIDVPVQDIRYLRVVVRRSLPVYGSAEGTEPWIDRLRSGQMVAIVEWAKKWRRVEWRDAATSELRSGWVRAKYIVKIKR
jgi:hypothetical protein